MTTRTLQITLATVPDDILVDLYEDVAVEFFNDVIRMNEGWANCVLPSGASVSINRRHVIMIQLGTPETVHALDDYDNE